MGVFTFVKAGKQLFNTIKGVGPKVNKTKLDTAKTNLAIGKQKLQGSTAKLKQTQFEIKNKLPITFGKSSKKTMSNTERAQKAEFRKKEKKQENKTKHYYVPENFNKGGRVGLKSGTQLSAKQMKIASLAGNKKKIDGPDFKKLRAMKSPMDKTVRKV